MLRVGLHASDVRPGQLRQLLGADDTGGHFVSLIGGTGQASALGHSVVQQITIVIFVSGISSLWLSVQTQVFTGCRVAVSACCQVSTVLGCPALGTGHGAWYHDGGGHGHTAHSTGNILLMMTRDVLILCSIQIGFERWHSFIIKLW